jgi:anaerobic magnesium-protoporphyrin IX monomethyl ester cyclase
MICLVRPPATESFRFATTSIAPPLGLAYVAAALEKAGKRVHVVDAVGEGPTVRTRYIKGYLVGLHLEDLVARIPDSATFVGITVIFTHEWPAVVRLIELLKARRPDQLIVLGGEHVTSMPEFCLWTSKADILVLGEGEETVVELAEALETGRSLRDLDGLAFRDGERLVVNRRRQRTRDIDAIPWPAWHLFKLDTYHRHRFVGGMYSCSLTIPLLATRGCPYQCTYCSAPNMWTPLWIPRDPIKVVDEIQHYVQTHDARNFPFQDLTAIIQKDWIVKFCKEILRRDLKITWQLPTGTRSEAIDPEVAELLGRSGMISIAYAPESGSENTRRLIKKKMRTDRLLASINAAVASNLNVSIFVVVGFPHDTSNDLAENLSFVDGLVGAGVTDYTVGFYMALPGTELFDSLYEAGKVIIDRDYFGHILHNLSLVPAQSYCDELNRLQLMWWKLRLMLRFYRMKGRVGKGPGLVVSVRRAISGLRFGEHNTRLQTAFRNGVISAWDTVRTQFRPGWMSRGDERRMFEGWNAIYQVVREQRRTQGVASLCRSDSGQLHRGNVVPALRMDHETPRCFRVHMPLAE